MDEPDQTPLAETPPQATQPTASPDEEKPAAESPAVKPPPRPQPNNPLHGLTLKAILTELVELYGWHGLGDLIPVKCFTQGPSMKSSLKFLRKTPWARLKVERLYLWGPRKKRR
ncbi:MAG: hypothetical protein ACI9OJ_002246 [Myxococcota bacterium]|jgi:hypothetical protein